MVFGECTSAVLMDSVENELLSKRFLVEAKHIFKFTNIYVCHGLDSVLIPCGRNCYIDWKNHR